ncbi:MAG TPA: DUF3501 family protein [Acidimicrobiales bacterium]|nr:DUF3501 family protein [Acidimicrobiales bacterium]
MSGRRLTLDDIADARAYERERSAFRERIIALKRIRRVGVGPVVSMVFENRDTVRFQIQEMARVERLLSDQAIQVELDTYNPLVPEPGELSASLFIELVDRQEMEHWLPRLVGIEQSARIELGDAGVVAAVVDPAHAANLTREEITAAVHFVRFQLSPAQVELFRTEPVAVAFDHPGYRERTALGEETRASLLADLLG